MEIVTDLTVGPLKYSPVGVVGLSRYVSNHRVAIVLLDPETGQQLLTATTNIDGIKLEDDELIIKDWSENEGCSEAFVSKGFLEDTGRLVVSDFVKAGVFRITGSLAEAVKALPTGDEFRERLSEETLWFSAPGSQIDIPQQGTIERINPPKSGEQNESLHRIVLEK